MRTKLASIALVLSVAFLIPLVASDPTLLTINFVHRHGARAAATVTSHGVDSNQAELTFAGRMMAHNLGTMLRSRYDGQLLPFPPAYDTTFIRSQSTEIGRTIQTGVGVLRGIWPDPATNTSAYNASLLNASLRTIPFISHTQLPVDYTLAPPLNWPNTVVRSTYFAGVYNDTVAREVLNTTSWVDQLNASAFQLNDAFGGSWCNDTLMTCALFIQDKLQCEISNSGLDPSLMPLEDQLLWLQAKYNQYIYPFDRNSPNGPVGSYGYPLASIWLANANAALQQFAAAPASFPPPGTTRIFHYSAHDNTVEAVWNTLGVANLTATSVEFWVPRFAQTIIMETWSDGTVAFFNGLPNETYGSGYEYSVSPLTVRCINPQSEVYYAPSCPIADLTSALATMAPAPGPSGGWCFLAPEDRQGCDALIGPLPSSSDPAFVTGILCSQYRQACPASACPSGTVFNRTDLTCLPVPLQANMLNFAARGSSAIGAAVGIVIGSFFVPMLLIAVVLAACRRTDSSKPHASTGGLSTSFLKGRELQGGRH